jgi:hypothetical protein
MMIEVASDATAMASSPIEQRDLSAQRIFGGGIGRLQLSFKGMR